MSFNLHEGYVRAKTEMHTPQEMADIYFTKMRFAAAIEVKRFIKNYGHTAGGAYWKEVLYWLQTFVKPKPTGAVTSGKIIQAKKD